MVDYLLLHYVHEDLEDLETLVVLLDLLILLRDPVLQVRQFLQVGQQDL